MLKSQYHFICKCDSCLKKEMDDFQERFSALKCKSCGGPIKNPNSELSLNHRMPCLDCGIEQEYKDQIQQVFLAYDLYSKVRSMKLVELNSVLNMTPCIISVSHAFFISEIFN